MAKVLKTSKIGPLSGKIGDVVTSKWNGISYVRDVPSKSTRPASQAQLEQRARFALMNSFMKKVTPYVNIGFKEYAVGKTCSNVAITMNTQHLIVGDYPDYTIDITKLVLSQGSLRSPSQTVLKSEQTGVITLDWKSNTTRGYAKPDDQLMILVFEETTGDVEMDIRIAQRSAGSYDMDLDEEYSGQTVHVFASFVSNDGQMVSDSVYVGSVEVA